MNHAWETYEFTPIVSKSHLFSKMCLILMIGRKVSALSFINEISIWSLSKNSKVYGKTKDLSSKYFWFDVIIHLRRCDIIREYAIWGNRRQVTTKYIWRHKNASSVMFDLLSIYENLKKNTPGQTISSFIKRILFYSLFLLRDPLTLMRSQTDWV